MEFWLGIMTAAWGFLILANGYAIWRYVYTPWKVMRRDVVALNQKIDIVEKKIIDRVDILENAIRPSKIVSMSDEQLASIENRIRKAQRVS